MIRQALGNMLLVGIGGSGRQSLTRIAAHLCEYATFQIEVTKSYRRQEFLEGLYHLHHCWSHVDITVVTADPLLMSPLTVC